MNATAKNGDVWTGETQDGHWLYRDANGNLYESKEAPAYRIAMDNAAMTQSGITPLDAYGYPLGWPKCSCGLPALDGKRTCGQVGH